MRQPRVISATMSLSLLVSAGVLPSTWTTATHVIVDSKLGDPAFAKGVKIAQLAKDMDGDVSGPVNSIEVGRPNLR